MMDQPPRSPTAPLLTRGGIRFILTTGILKAGLGLTLFFTVPCPRLSPLRSRMTAVFLYESLAQLAFAYPARRIHTNPTPNRVLNTIIVASVTLQILTITLPPLRRVLGLVTLDAAAIAYIAIALAATVLGAETWSRRAARNHTAE